MSLTFEALNAAEGDCLLLHHGPKDDRHHVVIDGGPRATWACSLKPRLEELRDEHDLDVDQRLPIELLVVSHIDNDHIEGVLAMLEELSGCAHGPRPWQVENLWCNTFDDKATTNDLARLAKLDPGGAAAAGEGRSVRGLAVTLGIKRNGPKAQLPSGFVARAAKAPRIPLQDLKLTVLSPTLDELTALQHKWDDWLAEHPAAIAGQAAAVRRDTSAPNLSSIVLLAEVDGHRVLLPGDAGAVQILDGLKNAGLLPEGGRCEVDIFKLPHHGSIRNVTPELFDRVRAKHYVISADGSNGNPDEATLELLGRVLGPSGDQTIWVTFAHDAWKTVDGSSKTAQDRITALTTAQRWLDHHEVKVVYREPDALGITIPLEAA
jgi:hypothetical protein